MCKIFEPFTQVAFSYLVYAFAFIMSSCLFPTGFAATTFYLAMLLALYFLIIKMKKNQLDWELILNRPNLWGLALFFVLGLSILWSQNSIEESLKNLMEYRYFFMIPLFLFAFSLDFVNRKILFYCFYLGSTIALIFSYLLAWRIIYIDGAVSSLADSIFHGFLMNFFLACNLSLFFESKNIKQKGIFFLICLAIAFNLLFIEDGRTAVLQFFVVASIYCVVYLGFKTLVIVGFSFFLVNFLFLTNSNFSSTVLTALFDFLAAMQGGYNDSSIGQRHEYYSMALSIIRDNFWLGVGIGDASTEFQLFFEKNRVNFLTDNVHSDFLNMFIYSGVLGFVLFATYFFSLFNFGNANFTADTDRLIFLSAVFILMIGCMFNSSIKDFGEKHFFCFLIPILMLNKKT